MAAEWITRGAGPRDSRELLDRARQPGRQPRRKRPDAAHVARGGDAGAQPRAGAGDFRRHGAPPPPRRRRGRADPGPLFAEPAEPRGRPGHQGHLRAAPPPFSRSLGTSLARDGRGGRRAYARRSAAFLRRRPTGPTARSWASPGRSTGPGCATPSAGCSAAGSRGRSRRVGERPGGPTRDHILRETQQIQIALAYPAATVASPDYYRAAPPPRSWAAIPRPGSSPKSARNAACATRSTPPTRASSTARPCFATPAPRPTGRSKPST